MLEIKKQLQKATEEIKASAYLDYKLYLDHLYHQTKKNLRSCSYVEVSEALGLTRTNVLFLIIKGKRPLSVKAANKIAESLNLKSWERKYFVTMVKYHEENNHEIKQSLFQELLKIKSQTLSLSEHKQQLQFYSEWYHAAIFELCACSNLPNNAGKIAKLLKPCIRPEQAQKSLDLLIELKLISFDENKNTFFPTQKNISAEDVVVDHAITRYHQAMMSIARDSLTEINEDLRDISSVTTALSIDLIPELKHEISLFRKKILALAEQTPNKTAVYQLNIQLFPLTENIHHDNKDKE